MARPSLTLAAIGAAALLLLAEGIARTTGDRLCTGDAGHVYQADAVVGWTYVPDLYATVARCDGAPMRPTLLRTDARGLPLVDVAQPKPAGVVRVLVLGGMSADGLGVRPDYRLEASLPELADVRAGARFDVANLSINGYTLDNDLLMWRDAGAALQPDVVLLMLDPSGELTNVSRGLIGARGGNAPPKRWMTLANDELAIGVAPPRPPAPAAATGLAAHSALLRRLEGVPAHTGPPVVFGPVPGTPDDQLPQENLRARTLIRRLLQTFKTETAAQGAKLGVLLAPTPGEWASQVRAPGRDWLASTAADLDIPTLDLRETFGLPDVEAPRFLPGTMRWSANGHVGAAFAIFQFLVSQHLVPETIHFTNGARAFPTFSEVMTRTWLTLRDGLVGRFVLWGLLGVALVWLAAPLSAVARDWVLVVVSLGVVGVAGSPAMAVVGLTVVAVFYVAVELLPVWLGRPIGWALMVLPLAAILATEPMPRPGMYGDERLFAAVAAALLWLRLALYAADRRAGVGAGGVPVAQYLGAMLAFPIVTAPPVLSPAAWAAARGSGLVDVASPGALRAHLGRSAVALGRLALGVAKIVVGPLVLGLLTLEAFADAGTHVASWRLWLWVLQLPLLLYLLMSGLADVAIAFAALLGVTLPEEFDAPWRVTGPIALWRRTNRSLAGAFRRLVYLPLGGGRAHASRNVVALFAAGGAWWLAWMVAFAGLYFYPPQAWAWPLCSALLLAAGALVARRSGAMPNAGLAFVATYCFVALAAVPLFVPGWASPSAVAGVLLRLVFLR